MIIDMGFSSTTCKLFSLFYYMLTCPAVILMLSESVRSDYAGPSDQAVLVNRNVSMSCKDVDRSGEGVAWLMIKVGSDKFKTIYSNHTISQDYEDRVRVQESESSYTLVIKNITPDDAGTYYCLTAAGTIYIAQLIVLESHPVCQLISSEIRNESFNGLVRVNESSIIEASCTIRLWGIWVPNMQWNTHEGLVLMGQNEMRDNTTITSVAQIAINSTARNEHSYITCITKFTEEFKPDWKGGTGSTSLPDYFHAWYSPSIFIIRETIIDERDSRHEALVVIISILGSILLLVLIVSVALAAGYRHKNRKIQLLYNRTNTISKSNKSEICRESTNAADHSSGYETYDLIDEDAMVPTIEPTKTSVYRQATNSYEEIPLYSEDSLKSNYQDVESSAANENVHRDNKLADPISDSTDRVYEVSKVVSSGNADGRYTKLDGQKAADQKTSGKYANVEGSMDESLNKKDFRPTSYPEIVADEMSTDYDYDNAVSLSNDTKLDGRNVSGQTSRDYAKCEGSMNESSIKTNPQPSIYLEIVAEI